MDNVATPSPKAALQTESRHQPNGYNIKPGVALDPWGNEYSVFIIGCRLQ